jgi:hypothetical protein
MRANVMVLVCGYAIVAATVTGLRAEVASAQGVAVGDDLAEVQAILGPPRGRMRTPELEVLYFELGTVDIRGGKVTGFDLMSPEEAAARRVAWEKREAEQREAAARTAAQPHVNRPVEEAPAGVSDVEPLSPAPEARVADSGEDTRIAQPCAERDAHLARHPRRQGWHGQRRHPREAAPIFTQTNELAARLSHSVPPDVAARVSHTWTVPALRSSYSFEW